MHTRLALVFTVALAILLGLPVQSSAQDNIAPNHEPFQVERLLGLLEGLTLPANYVLTREAWQFGEGPPGNLSPDVSRILDDLHARINGNPRPPQGELLHALRAAQVALSASPTSSDTSCHFHEDYAVATGSHIQLQRALSPGLEPKAVRKSPSSELYYVADNNQLVVRPPSLGGYILYGPVTLLAPLSPDPRTLRHWRRYHWELLPDSPKRNGEVRIALYHPDHPERYFVLGCSADGALVPLWALYSSPSGYILGVYEYSRIQGDGPIWLGKVHCVRFDHAAITQIDRFDIRATSIGVTDANLRLPVPAGVRLFDESRPTVGSRYYGDDYSEWPDAIAQQVVVQTTTQKPPEAAGARPSPNSHSRTRSDIAEHDTKRVIALALGCLALVGAAALVTLLRRSAKTLRTTAVLACGCVVGWLLLQGFSGADRDDVGVECLLLKELDLGIMDHGSGIMSVPLEVTNTSGRALTITRIRKSCVCVGVSLSSAHVPPGGSFAGELRIDTTGAAGPMTQSVFLDDETAACSVELLLRLNIKMQTHIDPSSAELVVPCGANRFEHRVAINLDRMFYSAGGKVTLDSGDGGIRVSSVDVQRTDSTDSHQFLLEGPLPLNDESAEFIVQFGVEPTEGTGREVLGTRLRVARERQVEILPRVVLVAADTMLDNAVLAVACFSSTGNPGKHTLIGAEIECWWGPGGTLHASGRVGSAGERRVVEVLSPNGDRCRVEVVATSVGN